jgi:hypothetical protein
MGQNKYFFKKLDPEQIVKLYILTGITLAFVSIIFVIAILLLGRLDVGDKWYEWKDDGIVIVAFFCIVILIMTFVFFVSAGLEAYTAKKNEKIKLLEERLDELKKD